ncbi:MAG: VOC family protein [Bacteroidales bacterium]|nr:VOC family protein [Bacteroidales bacterium]
MKLHSIALFVKDIEKSKEFYTNLLNLSIEHDFGKNVILSNGVTIWEIQESHIISKELETANRSNRFELYFEDENIDSIYSKLEQSKILFLHGIHAEPWGQRTFRFFDPDNHLIEVGEPLEVFVTNMHKQGLSADQISTKSGIPIATVNRLLNT